jgi:hypothetical protein
MATGTLARRALVALTLAAALTPTLALAQQAAMSTQPRPTLDIRGTIFKCEDGGELYAQFTTQGSDFVAIVQAADGPHTLAIMPWRGGEPRITWSDGARTLTWNPGVQIMYMDGGAHRMCGRDMGHHNH